MYKIYHNPRCKKSRAGIKFLEDNNLAFEIVKYVEEPVTAEELNEVLAKTGMKPIDLVRTQEDDYKTHYKGASLTDEQWVNVLVSNPKLLKRPIVVRGNKAVWADPPENIKQLF